MKKIKQGKEIENGERNTILVTEGLSGAVIFEIK